MLLTYWLRVVCLALFSLGTIQLALHLLLRLVRPLAARSIGGMTARTRERLCFAIPAAPHLLALLLTALLVIPQYIRNEANLQPERVGVLFFTGALAVAARYLYAILRASRLLRNKHEAQDPPVIITAGLPVHLTAKPYPQLAVTGFFPPRIVLSQHLLANPAFSTESLEIALAHEKAHIRHFDNLKHLILLSLVLPHHRAAAQSLERWRHAAEIAADEDAVSGNSFRAIQLAETLLIAARMVHPHHTPELSLSLLRHEENLDHRIHLLLSNTLPQPAIPPGKLRPIQCAAVLAAGACLGLILLAASFPRFVEYVLHLG